MKLLTPPEVVQALLDGKKVEIRGVIYPQNSGWKPLNEHEIHIRVLTNGLFIFRLAQEMITIGDVSFPKPASEPLADGTKYWLVSLSYQPYAYKWSNAECDNLYLRMGLVHLSKENATAHAKALIKLSGGTIDD